MVDLTEAFEKKLSVQSISFMINDGNTPLSARTDRAINLRFEKMNSNTSYIFRSTENDFDYRATF